MFSDIMKVLGMTFDGKMDWSTHVAQTMRKSSMMMSGLQIIRSKLTEDQFLMVATAQYYGVINYACQVWSTPSLNCILKKKLDVAHYKLLRLAIQDYKKDYPCEMLDLIGRAKNTEWAGYAVSSLVVSVVVRLEDHYDSGRKCLGMNT